MLQKSEIWEQIESLKCEIRRVCWYIGLTFCIGWSWVQDFVVYLRRCLLSEWFRRLFGIFWGFSGCVLVLYSSFICRFSTRWRSTGYPVDGLFLNLRFHLGPWGVHSFCETEISLFWQILLLNYSIVSSVFNEVLSEYVPWLSHFGSRKEEDYRIPKKETPYFTGVVCVLLWHFCLVQHNQGYILVENQKLS